MKKAWERFEQWLAYEWCDSEGHVSPASGARWHTKEDVRGDKHMLAGRALLATKRRVLVQAKQSATNASVSRKDIEKLVERASIEGRVPVVALAVGDLAIIGEVVAWR